MDVIKSLLIYLVLQMSPLGSKSMFPLSTCQFLSQMGRKNAVVVLTEHLYPHCCISFFEYKDSALDETIWQAWEIPGKTYARLQGKEKYISLSITSWWNDKLYFYIIRWAKVHMYRPYIIDRQTDRHKLNIYL